MLNAFGHNFKDMTKEELDEKVREQQSIIEHIENQICSYVTQYIEALPYKVGDKVSCSRCDVCWIASIVPEKYNRHFTGNIEIKTILLRKMVLALIESLYFTIEKVIVSRKLTNLLQRI